MTLNIQTVPEIENIPESKRVPILRACEGKEDLANLAAGNPDMEMPDFITERLKEHIKTGLMPYTHYYGLPKLRTALSQNLEDEWRIKANPETELLITIGVSEALYLIMRTILHPGDEILLPSPHYGSYYQNCIACGAKPVLVPLDEQNNFDPDFDLTEKAITPKTKALLFCNPNNPLGTVWSKEILEKLAEFALRHDLIILMDEIYREFTFYDEPFSIGSIPEMRDRTFTLGGFSKSYMMMGLRTGFVTGPAAVMEAVKKLHYCITFCCPISGQIGALAALECPTEEMARIKADFKNRIEVLYQAVISISGVTCAQPKGAFYIFPNFSAFGKSAMDLAIDMIEKANVIALPGTEFGELGESHLRLSVCARPDRIKLGISRLQEYATKYLKN
ncbi:MAG: pyridoxal phosphate-dependent aminotransferase [Deltaproteobacteria bacterium]|jgi:aminotransferase|nr:pyridoxal phosphate-dependent aminotransferase [Deltaproteobacteria bacterium]